MALRFIRKVAIRAKCYILSPCRLAVQHFAQIYGRVHDRNASEKELEGWLIAPLAWLLVALLSASLALLLYTTALVTLMQSDPDVAKCAEYYAVVHCVVRLRHRHGYYTLWANHCVL